MSYLAGSNPSLMSIVNLAKRILLLLCFAKCVCTFTACERCLDGVPMSISPAELQAALMADQCYVGCGFVSALTP